MLHSNAGCFLEDILLFIQQDCTVFSGFLTGTLQTHARKYNQPIDHLSFQFTVQPLYRDQEEVTEAMAKLHFGEEMEMDKDVTTPEDGVLVHGLFTDGFSWDSDNMVVTDSRPGEMNSRVPMLHMEPRMDYVPDDSCYHAPLYKTAARAGVLSTTGKGWREMTVQ